MGRVLIGINLVKILEGKIGTYLHHFSGVTKRHNTLFWQPNFTYHNRDLIWFNERI